MGVSDPGCNESCNAEMSIFTLLKNSLLKIKVGACRLTRTVSLECKCIYFVFQSMIAFLYVPIRLCLVVI